MRSFQSKQQFWAIGQTIRGELAFTPKTSGVFNVAYYSDGKFNNQLMATAKNPLTNPALLNYKMSSTLSIRQISVGGKHYFTGNGEIEEGHSIYISCALGLFFGAVTNESNKLIDTISYSVPAMIGKGNFKRLTLDLGLGVEQSVGAAAFLYGEVKAFIPSSGFPSPYLLTNKNAPFIGTANFGIRLMF